MSSNAQGSNNMKDITSTKTLSLEKLKVCPQCGDVFEVKGSWQASMKKYCSVQCRTKYNAAIFVKKSKVPSVEKECLQCGELFTSSHGTKKYCGIDCRTQHHAMNGWGSFPGLHEALIFVDEP